MKRMGLLLALLCMACGGSQTQSEEPTPVVEGESPEAESAQPHHGGEPAGKHHHHDFPPAVTAFHDVLAPLWHAEEGEARTEDTCNALPSFRERAEAITAEPVPAEAAGKEAEWQAAAQGLVDSIAVLEQACSADGRPEFASRFAELHDAFHALIELIGHKG